MSPRYNKVTGKRGKGDDKDGDEDENPFFRANRSDLSETLSELTFTNALNLLSARAQRQIYEVIKMQVCVFENDTLPRPVNLLSFANAQSLVKPSPSYIS